MLHSGDSPLALGGTKYLLVRLAGLGGQSVSEPVAGFRDIVLGLLPH